MAPLGYLDAGSGSMLLQIVLGGVAAIGVTAKMTWRRLLRTLRIRRDLAGDTAVRSLSTEEIAPAFARGILTGSEVSPLELSRLPWSMRKRLLDQAAERFRAAGAHAVIGSIDRVPALVDEIDEKLRRGERPG